MGRTRLMVLSVDAMVYEDLEFLSTLPNFKYLLENSSRINRVRTVYPALTYPIHTAIITGCWPEKNGVPTNENMLVGDLSPKWKSGIEHIKIDTIFDAAKRAGYTTGAFHWPVTADADDRIDYLLGETACRPKEYGMIRNYVERGSARIEHILRRHEHVLQWNHRPEFDEFAMCCARDVIREYAPEVMFIHQAAVDKCRHLNGVFNDRVTESLRVADEWLGWMLDALREAGVYDETNIVVLSDHGQMDTRRKMNINALLVDEGLIRLDADGNIADWDVFIQTMDLSAHVHLKDPTDKALYNRVEKLLHSWCDDGLHAIERVFTAEEVQKEYHLAGDFSFVIEGDSMTAFTEDWRKPVMNTIPQQDYRYYEGEHGHLPTKGPQPPFIVMGPAFKKGVVLETGVIVDEAPTFAKVLGVDLPEAQGSPIEELLL